MKSAKRGGSKDIGAIKMRKMSKILAIMVFTAIFLPLLPQDANGQKATNNVQRAVDPLQIKLVRSKVVIESGKEVLQSASVAKPGEILEEVAAYTNNSKSALKKLEATLPVPANTELVLASIKPASAKASVDGKIFANIPLVRRVKQSNGVELETPVPLNEYRYLRWYPGELAPAQSMIFSARFKVSDDPLSGSGK